MYKITENIQEANNSRRLNPGIYTNGRMTDISLEIKPNYSAIVLTLETSEGIHTERIFPIGDKFYPKDIYKDNKIVGKETEEQARERTTNEWLTKMLHIGTKFTDRDTITAATSNIKGKTDIDMFQDFARKFIACLGKYNEIPLNFKLVVKYGTTYACFPKTVKSGGFLEVYEEGKATKLKFSTSESKQLEEALNIVKSSTEDDGLSLDDLLGS